MKEKFKKLVNIAMIIAFLVGVLIIGLTLIVNSLKENIIITKQNLHQYTTINNTIENYSVFSALEECVNNLYEALVNERYADIYKLVGDNTRDTYPKTKIENELRRYANDVLGATDVMAGHTIKLNKAYMCGDSYLVAITSTYSSETLYMLINLDLYKYTYTIDLVM